MGQIFKTLGVKDILILKFDISFDYFNFKTISQINVKCKIEWSEKVLIKSLFNEWR